jgi:hypothetical protein
MRVKGSSVSVSANKVLLRHSHMIPETGTSDRDGRKETNREALTGPSPRGGGGGH